LLEEGLYGPTSTYKRVPYRDDNDEWHDAKSRAQVKELWPNGCRNVSGLKQCLPKLIILGQYKAGTTTLFETLAQHPGVLVARDKMANRKLCLLNISHPKCVQKEISGFARPRLQDRFNEYGLLTRYNAILPTVEWNDTRVTLEASPYYWSVMPDSYEDLRRFKDYIPGVKLIALVRDPTERAFSDYQMLGDAPWRVGRYGCSFGHNITFDELVEEELEIRSKELLNETKKQVCLTESLKWAVGITPGTLPSRYVGRLTGFSEYARHAEFWCRVYDDQQLYFLKSEDLRLQPEKALADLIAWAGLAPMPLLKVKSANDKNCRGVLVQGSKRRPGKCKRLFEPQEEVLPETRARLAMHFAPYNQALANLTGLNVSDWN